MPQQRWPEPNFILFMETSMKTLLRSSLAVLAIAGLLTASPALASSDKPAPTPAQLIIEDGAQFFTPAKVEEAKALVATSMGQGSRQVHVETFASLSATERAAYDAIKDKDAERKKFWSDWSLSKIKGDRGVSVLIVKDPQHFEVKVDRQMHNQGFDDGKETELKKLVLDNLKSVSQAETPDAKQAAFDTTLMSVANYVHNTLPNTTLTTKAAANAKNQAKKEEEKKEGSKVGTYICIGLCVLLGVWLVIGLIRAFSNRGGGGGPGGGGGGGGFGSSLLGGLFGAMAGMWLYNSMFGGHDSSAFGGDNSSGGGDYGESGGAGDYGGDTGGGGDYGGGGDDVGGGGDWGGGGGDFGGGGGDW